MVSDKLGNYSFIPDWLITEWGSERWKMIRKAMEETMVVERVADVDGYIFYDKELLDAKKND